MRTVTLPDMMVSPRVLSEERLVGLSGHGDTTELMAVGLDGMLHWQTKLERRCQVGDVSDSQIWLFEDRAILVFNADGVQVRREPLRLEEHERVGCLSRIANGVLVSVYREREDHSQGLVPRVIRLDANYDEVWSTRLPVTAIEFEGCVHIDASSAGEIRAMPPWTPKTWLPYGDDQLLISGNRVLASFQEMPRSGIGRRYVLDIDNGSLIWTSQPSPIASAASLNDGSFLMGDQGYGEFKTTLFKDDKSGVQSWRTHGYYTLFNEEIISLQLSNDTSIPQHLARLNKNGSLHNLSEPLPGYYSSKPRPMSDGKLYFWRAGYIWAWNLRDGLNRSAAVIGDEDGPASSLQLAPNRLAFVVQQGYAKSVANEHVLAVIEC